VVARVGFAKVAAAAGLYSFLLRREEELERWEQGQARRVHNGYPREDYPRRRRLDAFAAGLPVNVESGDIWGCGAVHDGAPVVLRPIARGRLGGRVTVGPDDVVTASDEDGVRAWLEENDL
jgi:hypothetical protein